MCADRCGREKLKKEYQWKAFSAADRYFVFSTFCKGGAKAQKWAMVRQSRSDTYFDDRRPGTRRKIVLVEIRGLSFFIIISILGKCIFRVPRCLKPLTRKGTDYFCVLYRIWYNNFDLV